MNLPNQSGTIKTGGSDLSPYLGGLYSFGVAAAAGLAVIMVIWGGIEYITSVAGEGKSGGKDKITSAILGLLLALGSYIILNTINKDLLKLSFDLKDAKELGVDLEVSDSSSYVDDFSTYNPSGYQGTPGNYSYLNSLSNDNNGNVTFSAYGYAGDDTPDYNSSIGKGNKENLLGFQSVALSPDLVNRLSPAPGAAVLVNGQVIGYYDDVTAQSYEGKLITNRIDMYDPSGSLGGNNYQKKTAGTITVDNSKARKQTPYPH